MIALTHLSMCYGPQILFNDVELLLQPGNRYGITGANGVGKSTFLRLIAGDEAPAEGTITIPERLRIGFLKQDQFLHDELRIIDVVIQGRLPLWHALQERDNILASGACDSKTGYRLLALEETIAEHDGYRAESTATMLLSGLGIAREDQQKPLKMLSGGFRLRVLLARALFDNPDILLLDEPTNYLDIASIAWLERYLIEEFSGLLLFISHDHAFMNRVATHILDIDYGEIRQYVGNYDAFNREKQAVVERKLHERDYLQKKIARMKTFVDRFRASTKARQAKSREKMIDRIEMPNMESSSRRAPSFAFTQQRPSGQQALVIKNVAKRFGEKQILNKVTVSIKRGEHIAIVGKNGIGKSTLLKIITDNLAADSGTYTWGHEITRAYFPQEHISMARSSLSVYDWLSQHTPREASSALYGMLGRMLFDQHDFNKPVSALSGGELARLKFAQIMLEKPNVLILDEPTNHLDMESSDALAQALRTYPGTIIVVSHDRYFMQHFAQRIITIHERGIDDFLGTYDDYIASRGTHLLGIVTRV